MTGLLLGERPLRQAQLPRPRVHFVSSMFCASSLQSAQHKNHPSSIQSRDELVILSCRQRQGCVSGNPGRCSKRSGPGKGPFLLMIPQHVLPHDSLSAHCWAAQAAANAAFNTSANSVAAAGSAAASHTAAAATGDTAQPIDAQTQTTKQRLVWQAQYSCSFNRSSG